MKLCPFSISNDMCIYCVYLNIPFSLNKNDLKQLYGKGKLNSRKKKRTIRDKIRKETLKSDLGGQKELPVLSHGERLMVRAVVYGSHFLSNKCGLA